MSQWTTKADDWMFKLSSFSATAGRTGFHGRFLMALYSRKTGFLADVSMNGSASGVGGNITFNVSNDWKSLDANRSFSPGELHGAPGSLKFGAYGVLVGSTYIWGSARSKGTRDYLFEDVDFGQVDVGVGISMGYVRGQWKFDHVWSPGGIPGPEGQAVTGQVVTESVGGG